MPYLTRYECIFYVSIYIILWIYALLLSCCFPLQCREINLIEFYILLNSWCFVCCSVLLFVTGFNFLIIDLSSASSPALNLFRQCFDKTSNDFISFWTLTRCTYIWGWTCNRSIQHSNNEWMRSAAHPYPLLE